MGESFVDVSYRGLELGRRLKLRDVRTDTGYLEIPLPMPVGTKVEIVVDDGVRFDAVVMAVHEQVGGSEAAPGMRVRPALVGAATGWWQARVDAAAEAAEKAVARLEDAEKAALAAALPVVPFVEDASPVASVGRATTVMSTEAVQAALAAADAAEGLADDGRKTDIIQVVSDETIEAAIAAGGRTTIMDAIDISMITGEAPSEIGVVVAGDDDDAAEILVESGGEVSADLEITPSGRVTNSNGNGKRASRNKSGRTKKKR